MRGNSGFLGPKSNVSLSSAKGIFSAIAAQVEQGATNWPLARGDFTVSPAINGQTTYEFSSFGDVNLGTYGSYTLTILKSFNALVKMWGAGAARGYDYSQTPTSTADQGDGGAGGFSNATISFTAGQTIIVNIGQGGARGNTAGSGATYLAGGIGTTDNNGGTQGGGYSGLFVTSVTQGNAWLIAGGGGAGGTLSIGTGGAGGGSSGGNSTGSASQGGQGGTQLAGGAAAGFNNATAGSALTGGVGQSGSLTNASLGGGGGGYYGGGGGNVGGGGGGSGYVSSNSALSGATTSAGSGATPGNSADSERSGAGAGGSATQGNTGADGRVIIRFVSYP